jgi:hypothetical protein
MVLIFSLMICLLYTLFQNVVMVVGKSIHENYTHWNTAKKTYIYGTTDLSMCNHLLVMVYCLL